MFNAQGYANSGPLKTNDRAAYLKAVMTHFKVSHPIVVSPSVSGMFSIPYIMKYPQDLGGYVPVAPNTSQLDKAIAQNLEVSSHSCICIINLMKYGPCNSNLIYLVIFLDIQYAVY